MREVGVLTEVSVTEQVLQEISKFPEILGNLRMRKQCIPGSFLPAYAREPGNKARTDYACKQFSVFTLTSTLSEIIIGIHQVVASCQEAVVSVQLCIGTPCNASPMSLHEKFVGSFGCCASA